MSIASNPIIDLSDRNPGIIYLDDGVAIAACLGSPEGLVYAAAGTLLTDESSDKLYKKTTAGTLATGWQSIGTPAGDVPPSNPSAQNDEFTSNTSANWTLTNFGTSVLTIPLLSTYASIEGQNGGWRAITKAVQAGDWSIRCKLSTARRMAGGDGYSGLVAFNGSGNGECYSYGSNAGSSLSMHGEQVSAYGFAGNRSPDYTAGVVAPYLRMDYSQGGNTITTYWSPDGLIWVTHLAPYTPSATPTVYGLGVRSTDTGVKMQTFFDWFRVQ